MARAEQALIKANPHSQGPGNQKSLAGKKMNLLQERKPKCLHPRNHLELEACTAHWKALRWISFSACLKFRHINSEALLTSDTSYQLRYDPETRLKTPNKPEFFLVSTSSYNYFKVFTLSKSKLLQLRIQGF